MGKKVSDGVKSTLKKTYAIEEDFKKKKKQTSEDQFP